MGLDPNVVDPDTRGELLELARSHRESLRAVIESESEYIQALDALGSSYRALTTALRDYRDYLEALVIWIPNHPPLWKLSLSDITSELAFIEDSIQQLSPAFSFALPVLLIAALLLRAQRARWLNLQTAATQKTLRPRDDSILLTLQGARRCIAARLTNPHADPRSKQPVRDQ